MLKFRVFPVLLFASLGLAKHYVVHAQEMNPAGPAKSEQLAGHADASLPLPEDPSAIQIASAASDISGDDSKQHADVSAVQPVHPVRRPAPAQEIAVEGFVSYGNWQIFAAGESEALYTAGMEYDRNSWGYFAGAQMDYVAEVLPFVLLRQPRVLNKWGSRRSKDNVLVPGIGFSPIGLRMLWRSDKAFKPYFTVKGGAVGFTQKALSPDASYYDFSLSESIGFYTRVSERWDMRIGVFGDYHFSNAYATSYNPGLDVMNSSIAFSYHLGGRGVSR